MGLWDVSSILFGCKDSFSAVVVLYHVHDLCPPNHILPADRMKKCEDPCCVVTRNGVVVSRGTHTSRHSGYNSMLV